MARTPTLPNPLAPFATSNPYAFGAFSLGSGQAPLQTALSDAAETRYEVGLRYNNGQASDADYQQAIAAELAIASQIAADPDASIAKAGKQRVAELTNLQHDVTTAHGEAQAAAAGDDALLAYYQSELAGMDPNSTAAIRLTKTISDMQASIASKTDADASRQASFEFQSAQLAWHNGTLSNDDYLAAFQKYVGAQKPGTDAQVNAQDSLNQATYTIHRNEIVSGISEGTKTLDDLLAFDGAQLQAAPNQNSQAYEDRLSNFQDTQNRIFTDARTKIDDDYSNSKMTAAQALTWYQNALHTYGNNPQIIDTVNSRIATFQGRLVDEQDQAAVDGYFGTNTKKPTLTPDQFMAFAATRAAAYPEGTDSNKKWTEYYNQAKNAKVENTLNERYQLSQDYITLQKFITDNSGPLASGSASERLVMGGDGHWTIVTSNAAPSPADVAAFRQRQAEVEDAKRQVATLTPKIAAQGGFVTTGSMLSYYEGLQANTAKGTPTWFTYQSKIDGLQDRQHYEDVLANGGVKVGYPDLTATGAGNPTRSASGGASSSTSSVGGGTGGGAARPGAAAAGGGSGVAASGTPATGSLEANASAFIRAAGGVDSPEMRKAVEAWFYGEGVGSSAARNNPGNLHSPGGLPGQIGSVNVGPKDKDVAVFATMADGIAAMAGRLKNPANAQYGYGPVLQALADNHPAAFLKAMQDSGWAENHYTGTAGQLFGVYSAHFGGRPPVDGGSVAPAAAGPAGPKTPAAKVDNGITIDQFLTGLGRQESGGDYNARNSATGAFGKYQIAASDWTAWAAKYLGSATAAQTPANQEKVVRARATELYGQYGSWQAVAHAWFNPGATAAENADPSKWGAYDSQYVTNVIGAAGGRVIGLPGADPGGHLPVAGKTPFTAPGGTGTPSLLRAITSSSVADVHGVPTRTDVTKPIDFPKNMDSAAFQRLYDPIAAGIKDGSHSVTYIDGSGTTVQVLLPDNPQDRAKLAYDMDNRNIALAAAKAQSVAGTPQEADASAALATAVRQSGENAIALLDQNYGGQRVVTDPVTGQRVTQDRGERANPSTEAAPGTLAKMNANQRNEAQTSNIGGVQTASLTPIASGVRVLDQAKQFVADQTTLAQQAADAGDFDALIAHTHMATQAVVGYGSFHDQISTYAVQGQLAIDTVTSRTAATAPAGAQHDQDRLNNAQGEISDALAPLDKLRAEKIDPFVQTDAKGNILYDTDGSAKMKPNVVLIGSVGNDGALKVEPKLLPAADFSGPGGALTYQDPTLAAINVATSTGKPRTVYVPWHSGTVGYITNSDGTQIPIPGKIVSINGEAWAENPLDPGHWAQGPLAFVAGDGAQLQQVAATDGSGNPDPNGGSAIQFTVAGDSYRFQLDTKTGNLNLIRLHQNISGPPTIETVGATSSAAVHQIIDAAGLGIDGSKMSTSQKWFLSGAVSGAWPGFTDTDVASYLTRGRSKIVGAQILNGIQSFARDPFGALTSLLKGGGGGESIGSDVFAQGFSKPGYPGPGGTLGPPPLVNTSPYNYFGAYPWQGGGGPGFFPSASVPGVSPVPQALASRGVGGGTSLIPVLGSAGYTPQAMDLGPTPALARLAPVASAGVGAGASATPPPAPSRATGNVQSSANLSGSGNVQSSAKASLGPPPAPVRSTASSGAGAGAKPAPVGGSGNVQSSGNLGGGGGVESSTTLKSPPPKPVLPPIKTTSQRPE